MRNNLAVSNMGNAEEIQSLKIQYYNFPNYNVFKTLIFSISIYFVFYSENILPFLNWDYLTSEANYVKY